MKKLSKAKSICLLKEQKMLDSEQKVRNLDFMY